MTGPVDAAAAIRAIDQLFFALYAGTLLGWALLWPSTESSRRLSGLHRAAAVALVISTVTGRGLRMLGGSPWLAWQGLDGAAAIARLALLVASLFFVNDLIRTPVATGRRICTLALITVIATTLLLPLPTIQRADWVITGWISGIGLLGLAGWVGTSAIALRAVSTDASPSDPEAGSTEPSENTFLGGLAHRLGAMAAASAAVLIIALAAALLIIDGSQGIDQRRALALGLAIIMIGLGLAGHRRLLHRVRRRPENRSGRRSGVSLLSGGLVLSAAVVLLS